MTDGSEEQGQTRREFLGKAWKWLGVLAAAEFAVVLGAYLWPRKGTGEAEAGAVVEAGPVAEFTPSSVTAFPQGRFYLVRLADGGFPRPLEQVLPPGVHGPVERADQDLPVPLPRLGLRHDGRR